MDSGHIESHFPSRSRARGGEEGEHEAEFLARLLARPRPSRSPGLDMPSLLPPIPNSLRSAYSPPLSPLSQAAPWGLSPWGLPADGAGHGGGDRPRRTPLRDELRQTTRVCRSLRSWFRDFCPGVRALVCRLPFAPPWSTQTYRTPRSVLSLFVSCRYDQTSLGFLLASGYGGHLVLSAWQQGIVVSIFFFGGVIGAYLRRDPAHRGLFCCAKGAALRAGCLSE